MFRRAPQVLFYFDVPSTYICLCVESFSTTTTRLLLGSILNRFVQIPLYQTQQPIKPERLTRLQTNRSLLRRLLLQLVDDPESTACVQFTPRLLAATAADIAIRAQVGLWRSLNRQTGGRAYWWGGARPLFVQYATLLHDDRSMHGRSLASGVSYVWLISRFSGGSALSTLPTVSASAAAARVDFALQPSCHRSCGGRWRRLPEEREQERSPLGGSALSVSSTRMTLRCVALSRNKSKTPAAPRQRHLAVRIERWTVTVNPVAAGRRIPCAIRYVVRFTGEARQIGWVWTAFVTRGQGSWLLLQLAFLAPPWYGRTFIERSVEERRCSLW